MQEASFAPGGASSSHEFGDLNAHRGPRLHRLPRCILVTTKMNGEQLSQCLRDPCLGRTATVGFNGLPQEQVLTLRNRTVHPSLRVALYCTAEWRIWCCRKRGAACSEHLRLLARPCEGRIRQWVKWNLRRLSTGLMPGSSRNALKYNLAQPGQADTTNLRIVWASHRSNCETGSAVVDL